MANEENLKHFKKGYDPRRNMNGAPKKDLYDIKSLLHNILSQEKNGQYLIESMLITTANKALKGDLKAFQMILDYFVGKPTQKTEIIGSIETSKKEIDLSKLSVDELRELERIASRYAEDPSNNS
jgi:hypothetical protein